VDTLWADVSEYQSLVDDRYPHPVLAIRACDGTYRDKKFAQNYAWALNALESGKLSVLIVYIVYRSNWAQGLATLKDLVGVPHQRMAIMIDVESWGGQIKGNQSLGLNALHAELATWLGDPRRVIGYGNVADLRALWPFQPSGLRHVVASYGSVPSYPGMLAHQYADNAACDPFGPCDGNSADGLDPAALAAALGLGPVTTKRKDHSDMDQLPATAMPADIEGDPARWPQRNFNVGFDVAGGWEGDCAVAFGVQDWGGPLSGIRGYLLLVSWILPDGTLIPADPVFSTSGKGAACKGHAPLGPWVAPKGALGATVNYAAPAGAYAVLGRSG
jgi:hypothetical protein